MKGLKGLVPMVIAGIIGGALTLTGLAFHHNSSNADNFSNTEAKQVAFRNNLLMTVPVSFDFREAAESAQKSVVRITAAESNEVAQRRLQNQLRNDPFAQFFFSKQGELEVHKMNQFVGRLDGIPIRRP